MKLEEFLEILNKRGLCLNDKQIKQLNDYASFLVEYNQNVNLTAITEYEDILEKHFYDSIIPGLLKKLNGTLVDVGTGAGFPGVVLKICFPELKVVLIETLQKRCVFLNELIKRLDLKDIEVINQRGEDYSSKHREMYDFVTARAVTNLNNLIEICGSMVKVNGYFICLRGLSGKEEIDNADSAIKEMGFEIESINEERLSDDSLRIISYFRKINKTPHKYPRKFSLIKKQPL